MKYTLESDVKNLVNDDCVIDIKIELRNEYMILWHDNSGYTITHRGDNFSFVSGVMDFYKAMDEINSKMKIAVLNHLKLDCGLG